MDLISDSQAGREKTVVNMGLSSMASGIDAVGKSIDYYAETLDPFVPAILVIINESSIILLPQLRKTICSAENHRSIVETPKRTGAPVLGWRHSRAASCFRAVRNAPLAVE